MLSWQREQWPLIPLLWSQWNCVAENRTFKDILESDHTEISLTKLPEGISVIFWEVFLFLNNPAMRLLLVFYILITCVVRCVTVTGKDILWNGKDKIMYFVLIKFSPCSFWLHERTGFDISISILLVLQCWL